MPNASDSVDAAKRVNRSTKIKMAIEEYSSIAFLPSGQASVLVDVLLISESYRVLSDSAYEAVSF